jgi:hypothetical protein
MMYRHRSRIHSSLLVLLGTVLLGCIDSVSAPVVDQACDFIPSTLGEDVPRCMLQQGFIDLQTFRLSDSIVRVAADLRDRLRADSGTAAFARSSEVRRAISHLGEFYADRLLEDSVRFDRMIDHIAVTMEYVAGAIPHNGASYYPTRTPRLTWVYYPNTGIYFQPVTSVQRIFPLLYAPTVSTDTLRKLADALWNYAVWYQGPRGAFPRWEYDFIFGTGGVYMRPPWQSAMAQGSLMVLFTELYKRTGEEVWRRRAYDVLRSYTVSWDHGGVLLPDTSHGYWWEEYNPRVMVWNGSVKALLTLGVLAQVMSDTGALRMYHRGLDALKYYTPLYDTGSWTLYSLTQGLNSPDYHAYCIQLLDAPYAQSGDIWLKETADRWRTYKPPY